ncbi:MAG: adenylyl-sulfate kinase [Gammaproteobacteria bacterium]|nr:adenylyl-sulfate kinase [Gammaproteobacteria bacterium]
MSSEGMKSSNTVWHSATVTRERREAQSGHKGVVLWFTGLSGSGKSTLAHAVEEELYQRDCRTFVLDGDNVRHGLCGDLGFGEHDRQENIRRVGESTKLFVEAGVITLTAFISPFQEDRNRVRSMFPHGEFLEIFCSCPLSICEERDVKGLYQRARAGEVKNFTGIDSPYEEPVKPELIVDTGSLPLNESVNQVMELLVSRGMVKHTL